MPIPHLKNSQRYKAGWRTQKKYQTEKKIFKFNKGKLILFFFVIPFLLILSISVFYISWLSSGLPDPNKLINRDIAQSTKIYDRTGETVLYDIHGEQQRSLINLNDLPDYIKQATISIEDKNFYKHKGFSIWAILRTAVTNILFNKQAGASTLTQQFIKNAVLTNEKSYTRKIKELILAYRAEKKFTKDEILQMYLNEIPYGSTAYGVEAASQKYFGKKAKDISLAEAAVLAAITQSPSRYSPYGSNKNILLDRQKYVIDLMVEQGYIEKNEGEQAKNQEVVFKKPTDNIIAPHFVMYVKEYLSEKYGEKIIEQGGLKIYTTIDLNKQKIAEDIITEQAQKNEEKFQASNAALVSIDPKNGQILAMVGSRDYFNNDIDGQVNITTSLRQPGSSIKPLVYTSLFLKGYTPNTILYDVVTNFSNDPNKPYEPHNYDGQEHGPITVRKSLAGSLNIPAVKALYLTGIDNVLTLAQDAGYSSLHDKDRFGLSLVLGGAEVQLLEHANAYSIFAREGLVHPIVAIIKIEDGSGNILEEFQLKENKVIDVNIARMINDILSDNNARSFTFGEKNWLTLKNRPVAAKTGTTNDYHDAWTIGYTPSLITGVWVGNSDNSAMKRGADGSVVAAPIWNRYMSQVLEGTPVEIFKSPEIPKTGKAILDGDIVGERVIKIDKISGLLATEQTPPELINEIKLTAHHTILFYVKKKEPLGPIPENPADDPQFNLWESRVINWENKMFASTTKELNLPTTYDNLHIAENVPIIKITKPTNNSEINNDILNATVDTSAKRSINSLYYYLNKNLFFTTKSAPFSLEQDVSFLSGGFYTLTAKACDDVDNCANDEIIINLIKSSSDKEIIKIDLISPQNGLAINKIDFPLSINFRLENHLKIAKISILSTDENNETQQLSEIIKPQGNDINFTWIDMPQNGTYKIFGEINTWQNQKITSNNIFLNVNNPHN